MTTEDKYNERMCRLIWHDALQCSIKTLSWGIDFVRVKVIKNGTEFHVHTIKITGNVKIQNVEGSGNCENYEKRISEKYKFAENLVAV